jgi:FAD:protein FMN transferase
MRFAEVPAVALFLFLPGVLISAPLKRCPTYDRAPSELAVASVHSDVGHPFRGAESDCDGVPGPAAVHQQRYCMGTMFEIVVYHSSPVDAERAVSGAMDEIARLDRVMSHFIDESDLSRLNREARHGFVAVDPALYEVIEQSIEVSRLSNGKFDVTIAPLTKIWKAAHAEGRTPSSTEIAAAKQCVGYERIDLAPPNRVRFLSDCLQIELGGIGKGYAVERAIAVLESAGIRNAIVNGGTSSIAAIGAPPGANGWPIDLPTRAASEGRSLLLRDNALSTSQQDGGIVDPLAAVPSSSNTTITVTAPSATLADALSTALVLMTKAEGAKLTQRFAGVTAIYDDDDDAR